MFMILTAKYNIFGATQLSKRKYFVGVSGRLHAEVAV
jgi:hypothetical protein